MTDGEIRRRVEAMLPANGQIVRGTILAIVVDVPHDRLTVQIFGPPSITVVETLEQATQDLRAVVEQERTNA